jgi:hypothetical protein
VSQDTDDPQSYTNYKRLTRNGINTDWTKQKIRIEN